MIRDSSEKSSNDNSNSDSDSNQSGSWVKHVTRIGRRTGLWSGWLDPSTGGTMQPRAVANGSFFKIIRIDYKKMTMMK